MYIVIMGGGKVGEYLASVLLGKGHEVAVLESDRDTADHLSVELQGELTAMAATPTSRKTQAFVRPTSSLP